MRSAGDFKCDGCPAAQPRPDDKGFSCKPMSSVTLLPDNALQSIDPAMGVIVGGGWRNRLTLPVIERLGIPVMHTWNQSVPLWEYHHGFQVYLFIVTQSSLHSRSAFSSCTPGETQGAGGLCSTCCAC